MISFEVVAGSRLKDFPNHKPSRGPSLEVHLARRQAYHGSSFSTSTATHLAITGTGCEKVDLVYGSYIVKLQDIQSTNAFKVPILLAQYSLVTGIAIHMTTCGTRTWSSLSSTGKLKIAHLHP